jgi:putative oligomerization/nucleic acid binding protein/phospholipase D-like protein
MDSFWDWFWLMVWWFFFIAYLMVLFHIIGDLFRDRELSGWWKALWIVFLIVLPAIGMLSYLIARGGGMARRSMAAASEARAATDAYIRDVASASSPADQIASAKALLDQGAITQAEFDALKAKALAT